MPTDIGEMQVGLSLDESSFTQSMNSVGQKTDELSGKFDSINADTKRTGMSIGSLGKSFALMGVAGAVALTSLAKDTPAVAGSMASIGISKQRIKNQLGEDMAPLFEAAASGLEKFADDVEEKGTLVASLDKLSEVTDKLIVDPITKGIENKASNLGETLTDPSSLFSIDRLGWVGNVIKLFRNRNQKEDDEFIEMNSPNMLIN